MSTVLVGWVMGGPSVSSLATRFGSGLFATCFSLELFEFRPHLGHLNFYAKRRGRRKNGVLAGRHEGVEGHDGPVHAGHNVARPEGITTDNIGANCDGPV